MITVRSIEIILFLISIHLMFIFFNNDYNIFQLYEEGTYQVDQVFHLSSINVRTNLLRY